MASSLIILIRKMADQGGKYYHKVFQDSKLLLLPPLF